MKKSNKIKCIVDANLRAVGMKPAVFARMAGVSRQLMWKHKENPRLNWQVVHAKRVVKALRLIGVEIKEMDLIDISEV